MLLNLNIWETAVMIAAGLIICSAIYIRLRWHRSPQAYRAMIALAACYALAGSLLGAWVFHLVAPVPKEQATEAAVGTSPAAAPSIGANKSPPLAGLPALIPPLSYDPKHAVLPDPKLTPGDTFPGATASDVCTPGWASEHRHMTEEMRDRVYAQYGRTRGPECCEVDHLIPLELGGSNDLKNLWPQPYEPRPGSAEKDQLENELHGLVCSGKMSLAEAQRCIASNWVRCWVAHELPSYAGAVAAFGKSP